MPWRGSSVHRRPDRHCGAGVERVERSSVSTQHVLDGSSVQITACWPGHHFYRHVRGGGTRRLRSQGCRAARAGAGGRKARSRRRGGGSRRIGRSVGTAAGGMESEDHPATAAVPRQESQARRRAHHSAMRPRGGGTVSSRKRRRDADGAMTLALDRPSVSGALVNGVPRRSPLGAGMASDGTGDGGPSTLGDSLAAVETKGETLGGSAKWAEGLGRSSAQSECRQRWRRRWSTTTPAIAARRTALTSAARLACRVQSNRDRWTRLTSVSVSPRMTSGSGVGAPDCSIPTATAPAPAQTRRAPRSSPPTESAREMPPPATVEGAAAVGRNVSRSCHRPNE